MFFLYSTLKIQSFNVFFSILYLSAFFFRMLEFFTLSDMFFSLSFSSARAINCTPRLVIVLELQSLRFFTLVAFMVGFMVPNGPKSTECPCDIFSVTTSTKVLNIISPSAKLRVVAFSISSSKLPVGRFLRGPRLRVKHSLPLCGPTVSFFRTMYISILFLLVGVYQFGFGVFFQSGIFYCIFQVGVWAKACCYARNAIFYASVFNVVYHFGYHFWVKSPQTLYFYIFAYFQIFINLVRQGVYKSVYFSALARCSGSYLFCYLVERTAVGKS